MRATRQLTTLHLTYVFVALCFLFALFLTITFFNNIPSVKDSPLAVDWQHIWQGLEGGRIRYGNITEGDAVYGPALRVPPSVALALTPLGLLSMQASWGVLTLLTLAVLVVAVSSRVPNKTLRFFTVLALITSYPSVRHIADGNLEGIVLASLLLLVVAFRIVVIPTMLWLGQDWFSKALTVSQQGSLVDISLTATVHRLEWPDWLLVGLWLVIGVVTAWFILKGSLSLNREKVGLLLCVSMLLAPYTAGNSYLTVLAIGIIPLFLRYPRRFLVFFLLVDVWYILPAELVFNTIAYFWTVMLLITWGVLLWQIRQNEARFSFERQLTKVEA